MIHSSLKLCLCSCTFEPYFWKLFCIASCGHWEEPGEPDVSCTFGHHDLVEPRGGPSSKRTVMTRLPQGQNTAIRPILPPLGTRPFSYLREAASPGWAGRERPPLSLTGVSSTSAEASQSLLGYMCESSPGPGSPMPRSI